MKRYHLWYSDIEGIENALTVNLTLKQFDSLQIRLDSLKRRSEPIISDYVLHLDKPSSYKEAESYLNDLEDDHTDYSS